MGDVERRSEVRAVGWQVGAVKKFRCVGFFRYISIVKKIFVVVELSLSKIVLN